MSPLGSIPPVFDTQIDDEIFVGTVAFTSDSLSQRQTFAKGYTF